MVDERFTNEVQEIIISKLRLALETEHREATNAQTQPVIQTVVKAKLLWELKPNRNLVLDEAETVVFETAATQGLQQQSLPC